MKVKNYKLQIRTLSPWSAAIGSIALLFFAACTDYVQDIEDQRDEWREEQASLLLSSEEQNISSSSKITSTESSDSKKTSSSSIAQSSSSLNPFNPEIEYGELIDSRDGQTYKTVKIGLQIWMAQNINYETSSSYCYNDSAIYCSKYGRLYTWAAAMDSTGTWSTNGKGCGYSTSCSPTYPVRGVCPEGWHLPTQIEWETLFAAAGDSSWTEGANLKSTIGWYGSPNGTNAVGFSALPAGHYYNQHYTDEGGSAYFWSSTEKGSNGAYYMLLYYGDRANLTYRYQSNAFSVRCLKDDSTKPTAKSSSSETAISSSSEKIESSSSSSSTESSCSSEIATTSSSNISQISSSGKKSWAYLNPAISYGEITDNRDGQVYKTIEIGEQEWMAENLNYETRNGYCYDDEISNCSKYGRLYIWSAAMDSVGEFSTNGSGCGYDGLLCSPKGVVRGICPEHWHLPNSDEWNTLLSFVSHSSTLTGNVLMSASWNDNGNETNFYGFSAIPAGRRNEYGGYSYTGEYTYFWSASEKTNYAAYQMSLQDEYGRNIAIVNGADENFGLSIRCLKDNPNNILESSSSEDAESSSSKESWAYLNSAISYGEITDSRDGQIYKTVVIGKQTWMAENLNFETDSSFCYNNEESNCAKYGRLYRWAAAMDTLESECGYGSNTCSLSPGNVQGVCPSGWHLPSMAEWDTLIVAVGGQTAADKALKSSIGWSYGTDDFGFSAFPAGGRDYSGDYDYKGSDAHFWSSTEKSSTSAYYMLLKNGGGAGQSYSYKNYAYSIRCVKDD